MLRARATASDYPTRLFAVSRQRAAPRASPEPRLLRPRLAQLPRRCLETLDEGGARALFSAALAAAGIRRLAVYRLEPAEVLARGHPVTGVTVRLLSNDHVPEYLDLRPETPHSELMRRLHAGAECIAAWRDGRLVAARWVQTGRVEISYLGAVLDLCPGVWYAYDAFTTPAERRRGVSGMVAAALVRRAADLGATSVINAVLPENRGGRGLAHRRSRPVGVLRSVRVGPWRLVGGRLPSGYLRTAGPFQRASQTG